MSWSVTVLTFLTAALLQVLSNIANDLGDHQHGTDGAGRIGPTRAVQSGAISVRSMQQAIWLVGLLAFITGCALIVLALGLSIKTLVFLVLGLLAIAAAVRYTYGATPYGYHGLGDASVFLFFGPLAVLGTFYLHLQSFWYPAVLPALGVGALATAVLNTNNLRDIGNDAAHGKRTLAVRLGAARAKTYHAMLIVVGLLGFTSFTFIEFRNMSQWAFLLGMPILATQLKQVMNNMDPRTLDKELPRLVLGTLLTTVAFSLGLWKSWN